MSKPKKKKKQKRSSTVAMLSPKTGKTKTITNPVQSYGIRNHFRTSEYNLAEIGAIEDGESYVRQAFQKKTALMFKEGESFSGKNELTIAYVKRRFREMEFVTGVPMRALLRQTGYSLVSRSNYFWVKVRNKNASSGKTVSGRAPVAGYFGMAPETVTIKKDKNGKIVKYRQQMPDGRWREFSPENVIHFSAYRKTGFLFGTPQIVPVIEDIHALRRLEEQVEIMMHQNLFPIFQYKVGTEAAPAGTLTLPDGSVVDEVSYVRDQVSSMPTEGGFVTPERHKIEYIGANGQIPNYKEALDYFKGRVLAGLGISSLDIGDGSTSTRSTADSLSKSLVDSVKDYQDIFEQTVNYKVIPEILLEGDFSFDPLDEENFTEWKFKEIDIEEQLKKNVNAQLMYNADIIDVNEAREKIGKEPLSENQEPLMYTERQELRVLRETAVLTPKPEASTPASKSGKSGKAAVKTVKNKSAPTNQHGTKTGPQKSLKDKLIASEVRLLKEARGFVSMSEFLVLKDSAEKRLEKKVLRYKDELDQDFLATAKEILVRL